MGDILEDRNSDSMEFKNVHGSASSKQGPISTDNESLSGPISVDGPNIGSYWANFS